jgi:hypothetical protein
LIDHGGQLLTVAKSLYGWSHKEYFYYFHSKEVQEYLYFNSNSDRTIENKPKAKDFWRQKILDEIHKFKKSGREIKVKSIAQEINCSPDTLHNHGLCGIIHEAYKVQQAEWLAKEKALIKSKIDRFVISCYLPF